MKKLVIHVPNRNIQVRVLRELLQDHNILGVTTSKWRAQEAQRRYSGDIIYKDTNIYQIERECKAHKGNLYWIYYGSKHGRAINTLACFDAVIFQEFLDKSDQLTLGVNTQYEENCVKKLYQTASRVLRTVGNKHRARSLITCNPHAFELLKGESPLWQYEEFEHAKDAVERIKEHTEPLPTKAPLKPVKLVPRYDKKREKHYLVGEITPDHLRKYGLKELILTDDDIWSLLHKESESE